jgi:hypothetical protein
MRFVYGDVRILIVSHENDYGPSHRRRRALQRPSCLEICFREIFGVFRLLQQYRHFSDMALQSLHVSYWGNSGRRLLAASISPFDPKRTSAAVWSSDVLIA